MGFGSYDESERENQTVDTDFDEGEQIETTNTEHRGNIEFEFTASNDELLDQLRDIKDDA